MILIRCLKCDKVLGEFEGKWRVKCKQARCGIYNQGNTITGAQVREDSPMEMPYSMTNPYVIPVTESGLKILEEIEESRRMRGLLKDVKDKEIKESIRDMAIRKWNESPHGKRYPIDSDEPSP